jgi:hypothetical protein
MLAQSRLRVSGISFIGGDSPDDDGDRGATSRFDEEDASLSGFLDLPPSDVGGSYPERPEPAARLEAAHDAHVGAGPLRGPAVEFALPAVDPPDTHRDRDRWLAMGDVVAVELAPPLVRGVLDGLPVHPTSVEQMFALWKGVVVEARVSCRPRGRSPVAWLRDDAAPLLTGAVARARQHPRARGSPGVLRLMARQAVDV